MSDIPAQDKPLNAYDLKAIGDYVATIKYFAPNKSTMSEKPRELELIDNFYNFVDRISEALNTLLIDQLGEDANWDDHAGISELPYKFLTAFKHRSEAQKLFAELWELREESNGLCASLDEYKPHEWAKELYEAAQPVEHPSEKKTEINWEEQYERQLTINQILIAENQALINKSESKLELDRLQRDCDKFKANLQATYDEYKKSAEQEFRCLKAEIITSLRAIDLCLLASLCTGQQWLTHKARNFRMKHVHQIISNEIDRFGDRKLTSYEDDF